MTLSAGDMVLDAFLILVALLVTGEHILGGSPVGDTLALLLFLLIVVVVLAPYRWEEV